MDFWSRHLCQSLYERNYSPDHKRQDIAFLLSFDSLNSNKDKKGPGHNKVICKF